MTAPLLIRGPFCSAVSRTLVSALLLSLLSAPLDAQSGFIERKPVHSSDLASVGYGARQRVLEIEFRSGGYLPVPRSAG